MQTPQEIATGVEIKQHGLPRLDRQRMSLVHHYVRSHNIKMAANAAGCSMAKAKQWLEEEDVTVVLEYYDKQAMQECKVDRESLTLLLFEAHRKSATATEEIAAIRELGKMNGVYAPEKVQTQSVHYHKIEHLETLSDDELLDTADIGTDGLIPETVT